MNTKHCLSRRYRAMANDDSRDYGKTLMQGIKHSARLGLTIVNWRAKLEIHLEVECTSFHHFKQTLNSVASIISVAAISFQVCNGIKKIHDR